MSTYFATSTSKAEAVSNFPRIYWLFYIASKEDRDFPDHVYACGLALIILISLVTHLASLYILFRDHPLIFHPLGQSHLSQANLLYTNILAADLTCILGFLPLELYWTFSRRSLAICKIIKFSAFLGFYSGCLFLVAVAVDRYIAIFKPLKHLTRKYKKTLYCEICLIWLGSLGIAVWQAWEHQVGPSFDNPDYFLCGAPPHVAQSIFIPITALFSILPFIINMTINVSITSKLIKRDRKIRDEGCAKCRLQGTQCNSHLKIGCFGEENKSRIGELMKMKTVKMTVIVALCLLVSQVPGMVLWTWAWFYPGQTKNINPTLIELVKVLQYTYVCIVPILHGSLVEKSFNMYRLRLSFEKTYQNPVYCVND